MATISPYNCFVAPLLLITTDLINRVLSDVVAANAVLLEEMNRQQLAAGIRADGSEITPDYTRATVQIKQGKGQPTDKVRLKDTGSFYQSIFVDVFKDAFEMKADDGKTLDLKAKYGDLILGLTEANKLAFANYIKPQFITRLRAEIGL